MSSQRKPDRIDKYVGHRIRARRMALSMSQEKLAEGLRITFQQVQKYERGTNRVGAGRLQQIATLLGVGPAHFFEGAPIPGTASVKVVESPFKDMEVNPQGLRLARAFVKIDNADQRSALVAMAEAIAA